MTAINTNVTASITANALTKNERAMNQAMERLSTGQRINSADDDAAGLAMSSRMTSQVNGLNMAVRNANDAISMIQTADGALEEMEGLIQRMRELAVQAASGTMGTNDIAAVDTEFDALRLEINRIAINTQWNGISLLGGYSASNVQFNIQIGANASQTINVFFYNFQSLGDNDEAITSNYSFFSGLDNDGDLDSDIGMGSLDLTSTAANNGPTGTMHAMTFALMLTHANRTTIGARLNRLEYALDNLANISLNTSASRSRISDTNYARETTELAKTQIIQQAATAMLSQANQYSQSVLSLLK